MEPIEGPVGLEDLERVGRWLGDNFTRRIRR